MIYCESGWYNTIKQTSSFHKNAYLQTETQLLRGDSVLYDRNSGIGRVFGNVSIEDTTNKIIIGGDYGEHHEVTDSSWVTGHALMSQILQQILFFYMRIHCSPLAKKSMEILPHLKETCTPSTMSDFLNLIFRVPVIHLFIISEIQQSECFINRYFGRDSTS
ncbi:MAG: hypothetical protein IPP86_00360 [Bacteroidetes bacterium]|nr:hypothetical protein [Bacteroidota bacterium]